MISYSSDNIWDTTADYIVVPVNTVGVAGAGLAKQWRQRYPEQYERYNVMCARGAFLPGEVFFVNGNIVLVFTKEHYKKPSRLEWIEKILFTLKNYDSTRSLALPKIGCGYGKLDWPLVNHLIKIYLEKHNVIVYGEDI